MPAPYCPPVAIKDGRDALVASAARMVSVALLATSMPAEYFPAVATVLEPESTSATSRENERAEAFCLTGPTSVRFLNVTDDALEADDDAEISAVEEG